MAKFWTPPPLSHLYIGWMTCDRWQNWVGIMLVVCKKSRPPIPLQHRNILLCVMLEAGLTSAKFQDPAPKPHTGKSCFIDRLSLLAVHECSVHKHTGSEYAGQFCLLHQWCGCSGGCGPTQSWRCWRGRETQMWGSSTGNSASSECCSCNGNET